jgi:hypothetical protein
MDAVAVVRIALGVISDRLLTILSLKSLLQFMLLDYVGPKV